MDKENEDFKVRLKAINKIADALLMMINNEGKNNEH